MILPRPPEQVMRLHILGAFCQTRLSFMRVLLRRLKKENWTFSCTHWNINNKGEGVAVYRADNSQHVYSLIVFAHDLPAHKRSDRVIADAWDATFTLFDGIPSAEDIKRMQKQVPLQEAGRNDRRQIVLSRANRSVRTFNTVVETLASGRQPATDIAETGYLMRTTAVYGNGKFGIAVREHICRRPEFASPFAAELLAVFMFRAFAADWAEYMAAMRSSTAATLSPALKRTLGIGNSTGLGMAPFLINHPMLLHHWIIARETALARIRALPAATTDSAAQFMFYIQKAEAQTRHWKTADNKQQQKNARLQQDLQQLQQQCKQYFNRAAPWNTIYEWGAQHMSIEGRETLVSLLIEPHGELIDDLATTMACDESFILRGDISTGDMHNLLMQHYAWASAADFSLPTQNARFWYVAKQKLEPRLGERYSEPGAKRELPLTIMRDAQMFMAALATTNPQQPLAIFLAAHPQHRHIARRAQILAQYAYSEIRDNLIAADMLPLDLLRCKLSFFGATRFDPRSDRWLRINMFQHAPYPNELSKLPADEWAWAHS